MSIQYRPLPLEVVIHVMEQAYHFADGSPDRKTLAALSTVCKAWTPIAQRLLFHHTAIGSKRSRVAVHIQYLLNKPALGTYVRCLRLDVFDRRHLLYSPNRHASESEFIDLMTHLPQLYQLIVRFGMARLEPATVARLKRAPVRLQAVDLLTSPGVPSSVVYQLFDIWPTIRFLIIRTQIHDPPCDPRPSFALYEFRMLYPASLPAMEWFIPPNQVHSETPLQILDIGDLVVGEYGEDLVLAHAPHLRSLSLVHEPEPGFLEDFPRLEELVIRRVPQNMCAPLPATLRHVGFYTKVGDLVRPLRHSIDIINAGAHLRYTTVNFTSTRHKEYPSVIEACDRRGIQLIVKPTDGIPVRAAADSTVDLLAHTFQQEYLVPTDRFPRLLSFFNLRKMDLV